MTVEIALFKKELLALGFEKHADGYYTPGVHEYVLFHPRVGLMLKAYLSTDGVELATSPVAEFGTKEHKAQQKLPQNLPTTEINSEGSKETTRRALEIVELFKNLFLNS
jgi:hypothetical protein